MSHKIANLTLTVLNKEIDQFLADYSERDYIYLTLSVNYFRLKLIAKILSQIPNRYIVVDESEEFFEQTTLSKGILQERLLIEDKIRENIPYILNEKKSEKQYLTSENPVEEPLRLPFWIKCQTIIPAVTYFLGPFDSVEEAKLNLNDYVADLIQEKAEGISWEINHFQPTSLTIFHDLEEIEQENQELWGILDRMKLEKQYYQDLFQFAPESYVVTDLKGIIQKANKAAGKLLDTDQQNLVGKSLNLFVSQSHLPQFYNQFEQWTQEETIVNYQSDCFVQVETPNLSPVTVNIKSSPMMDIDNQKIGLRFILCNFTEESHNIKQLYQESRYDSLTHLIVGYY